MDPDAIDQITYAIVPNDGPNDVQKVQVVISEAEARAMILMPGGFCLGNWLKLRGLTPEPVSES
jgi:hypothetical protein